MTRDILWAIRWLARNPLFTAGVTMILALGIGANTAVFSIVDAVMLQSLPYTSPHRLVKITQTSAKSPASGMSAQEFLHWRDRNDVFEKSIPFLKDIVTLTGSNVEPDQVAGIRTSGALFPLLGVQAQLGRGLIEADDNAATGKPVVISDRLWRKRFHADPQIVGRPMTISGEVFTIAGVMPPVFEFPASGIDFWTPVHLVPDIKMWFDVVARLRPGVSTTQARSAMEVIARQMEQEDPTVRRDLKLAVEPWSETLDRKYELTLLFVLGAVGLVLLIACADVGGLLLSRAVQRQKEIAIRASLGASFWRVVRQLLAESLVIAALGSVAGTAVAYFLLAFLSKQLASLPVLLPHLQRVSLNGRVLLFNTALCFVLAVLCSVAPALLAIKTDVQAVLRGGRTAAGSKRSARLFSILIGTEAALAFLLLVGSGLMIRSLIHLQQQDHGFRPDHVLTLRVPVGMRTQLGLPSKYDTRPRQMAYYREILQRVETIPGIQAVAIVNNLPLSGVNASTTFKDAEGRTTLVSTRTISPKYFAAMGTPLLAGRLFTDEDQTGAPNVAIINETLARQTFPNENPLGKVLPSPEAAAPPVTVVGVVKDAAQMTYDQPAKGEVYRPIRQFIFAAFMTTIVVRTNGDPLALANALQKEVWAVDPNQPVIKIETLTEVVNNSIWRPRFSAWIFSVLGLLAVLLTSVGVYGIIAYTTSLRAQEVGIRVALGATPRDVIAVVVRGAMIPVSIGLAISLVASLLLSRLLASLLYEIDATDPLTYIAVAALLLVVGTAASARPAWRAATADPLTALRAE